MMKILKRNGRKIELLAWCLGALFVAYMFIWQLFFYEVGLSHNVLNTNCRLNSCEYELVINNSSKNNIRVFVKVLAYSDAGPVRSGIDNVIGTKRNEYLLGPQEKNT